MSVRDAPRVWTVVVAAGSGRRFGAEKQFQFLGGHRVVDRSCELARTVGGVVVVLPSLDDVERWIPACVSERAVVGGATRSASVRAGLAAVPPAAEIICVHDAARPLASTALFGRVIGAVSDGAAGAVPGVPVTDTVKVVDASGVVMSTLARETLVAVQTPQAFAAAALRAAHAGGGDGTDDAALVEATGARVVVVAGEAWNRKITEPPDLEWARSWLAQATR
jgi:2-C-methyl-D-erythritol 4-phosphate cytidylyltransferase